MTLSWFLLDLLLIAHLAHETGVRIPSPLRGYDEWIGWMFLMVFWVWALRLATFQLTLLWMGVEL